MSDVAIANPVATQSWLQWAGQMAQKGSDLAGRSVEWLKINGGPFIQQCATKAQEVWKDLEPQINKVTDSVKENPWGAIFVFVAALAVLKIATVVKNKIFG